MKFLFFTIALGGSIAIGLFPAINKPRPLVTRLLTIALIVITIVLALYPPTVGTLADAVRVKMAQLANSQINVVITPDWNSYQQTTGDIMGVNPESSRRVRFICATHAISKQLLEYRENGEVLVTLQNRDDHSTFEIKKILGKRPTIMLPYIPALEERARILYFHVPMSWVAFLAYTVTLVCSVLYIRTSGNKWDIYAVSSATVGTVFCILAYVTGAIWAKFNWGKFFNADSKELSILVLLLIYAAYFVLRGSIDNVDKRARLSGVYAIIACIAAFFLMFIIPRITDGLHPGSQDDVNAGPVISPQKDSFDTTKAMIFSVSLAGFTLVYFWIMNLQIRVRTIADLLYDHTDESESISP